MGRATPSSRAAPPSAARGTCSATPASRSDSDMYTLGYSFRPWREREGHRRRRVDPAVHPGHRGGVRHRPRRSGSTTRSWRADWSTADGRVARHRRAHRHRRAGRAHVRLPVLAAAATTATTTGYQPDFAGIDDYLRHHRAPAVLARGPRLRRQAGRRHRQRRHRRHADAGDGPTPPPTSRCSSARRPTSSSRAGESTRSCKLLRAVLPGQRRRVDRCGGRSPCGTQASYFAQQAAARAGEAACCAAGARAPAPQGLRHRHPLHPALQPVGPAALRSCPTATCSRPSAREGVGVVTDHIDTLHRDRASALESGDGARGRRHRHRHRPQAAVLRWHRRHRRRRRGRRPRPADLQGDDARGRAQLRPGHRLHERLVDAEVRPDRDYVTKLARTTCTTTGCASAPRATTAPRRRPSTVLRASTPATSRGPPTGSRKQGATFPWRVQARATSRLPGACSRSIDDGDHAVLQPGPRTRGRRHAN